MSQHPEGGRAFQPTEPGRTAESHVQLLSSGSRDAWLRLFSPGATVSVEGEGRLERLVETPRSHWDRRFADSWESCVTLLSMAALDDWATVSWIQTTLRASIGVVTLGVDVIAFGNDGRILSIRQHVEGDLREVIV